MCYIYSWLVVSVGVVIILIIVHHLFWDRDPTHVPPYVKRALQFDLLDDDFEDLDGLDNNDGHGHNKNNSSGGGGGGSEGGEGGARDNIIEIIESEPSNNDEQSDFSSHKARKMANLDKFMNKDLDVSSKY